MGSKSYFIASFVVWNVYHHGAQCLVRRNGVYQAFLGKMGAEVGYSRIIWCGVGSWTFSTRGEDIGSIFRPTEDFLFAGIVYTRPMGKHITIFRLCIEVSRYGGCMYLFLYIYAIDLSTLDIFVLVVGRWGFNISCIYFAISCGSGFSNNPIIEFRVTGHCVKTAEAKQYEQDNQIILIRWFHCFPVIK